MIPKNRTDEQRRIGEIVRQMRENAGIRVIDLAWTLDVDPKTIWNREHGVTRFDVEAHVKAVGGTMGQFEREMEGAGDE